MGFKNAVIEKDVLLTHTTFYAQSISKNIFDMTGTEFSIDSESFQYGNRLDGYPMIVFSSFFGKIMGMYMIALNEITASHVIENLIPRTPQTNSLNHKSLYSGLLKELVNIGTAHSLAELKKQYDTMVHFSPVIVYGSMDLPNFTCASMLLRGESGDIQCSCWFNLVTIEMGKKLEEAQSKLQRIHKTHHAMFIKPEDIPEAQFDVFYQSLHESGGDIYDVIKISSSTFGYFVGDVSGHDIETGFITAAVKALIKQNCKSKQTPISSMMNINSVLCELLSPFEYITGCYIVIDRQKQTAAIINMGHPPVLFIPREGEPHLIYNESDVLGAFENCNLAAKEYHVSPGDRFIVYTDGLVEGSSFNLWTNGVDKLLDYADILKSVPLDSIARMLFQFFYKKTYLRKDDIVILGLQI